MTLNGKSKGFHLTTGMQDIYVCPVATTAYVLSGQAANVASADDSITLQRYFSATGATVKIANATPVPKNGIISLIAGRFALAAGDKIQAAAGSNSAVDFTLDILEVS